MRIYDGIRPRSLRWWRPVVRLLPAAVASLVLSGAAGAAERDAGQGADLSLLRQFHSYSPARVIARSARADEEGARSRALLGKARAAWRAGNYAAARIFFRKAFEAGAVEAAWYLGYLYRTGRGGEVDHEKAFFYYQALARRFDPDERNVRRLMMSVDALVRVADYYRTGIGKAKRRRDPWRAFRLYNLAAAHNHPGAFYGMALIALQSDGRIARKRWAIGWLKQAARAGMAAAALQLARLAQQGLPGVFRSDPVAAAAWRIIAARLKGPKMLTAPVALTVPPSHLSEEQRTQALQLAERFLSALGSRQQMAPSTTMAPTRPAAVQIETPRQ